MTNSSEKGNTVSGNPEFIPLPVSNAAGGRSRSQDDRVTLISNPEKARPLHAAPASAPEENSAGAPGPARGNGCEPRITLQHEGNRVSGIRVKCSCGQTIDLNCLYPDGATQAD